MTSGLTARTDLGQTPAPIIKSSRHNTSCFPMLRLGIVRLLCQQANVQLKHVAHPPAQGFSQGGPQMAAAAAAAAQMIKQCWAVPMLGQSHWQLQQSQQLHTSVCSAAPLSQHVVQLDRLRPAPGSSKLAKRWGRGDGSDRGTYCGRGVKGQKARKGGKPHLLFDGGQNQMKKFPKVWLTPRSPVLYQQLGLSKVLRWVKLGLLDANTVITMKDLRDSGCAPKTIRWGVELVANGEEQPQVPLHLQVSSVNPKALRLVEAAGGSVERVYYTRLGLKALLKPENFAKKGLMLPRPVRAWPPRENGKFDCIGQLPPVKQQLTAQAAA